jgi:hypothetical protein
MKTKREKDTVKNIIGIQKNNFLIREFLNPDVT